MHIYKARVFGLAVDTEILNLYETGAWVQKILGGRYYKELAYAISNYHRE